MLWDSSNKRSMARVWLRSSLMMAGCGKVPWTEAFKSVEMSRPTSTQWRACWRRSSRVAEPDEGGGSLGEVVEEPSQARRILEDEDQDREGMTDRP